MFVVENCESILVVENEEESLAQNLLKPLGEMVLRGPGVAVVLYVVWYDY